MEADTALAILEAIQQQTAVITALRHELRACTLTLAAAVMTSRGGTRDEALAEAEALYRTWAADVEGEHP